MEFKRGWQPMIAAPKQLVFDLRMTSTLHRASAPRYICIVPREGYQMGHRRIISADFELLARISTFFSDAFVELELETEQFSKSVKESISNFRIMHGRGEHRSQIMAGMREGVRDYLSGGSDDLDHKQKQELSCRFYDEFNFQISELDASWPGCRLE